MKISELARELNVKVDTIRYYEKIGLIPEAKREENGYRVYPEEYVELIRFILSCKENGFTLKEIKDIMNLMGSSEGDKNNLKEPIRKKIKDIENKIHQLQKFKEELKELLYECNFNECSVIELFKEGFQQENKK